MNRRPNLTLSRRSMQVVFAGLFAVVPMVASAIVVRGWVYRVDAGAANPFFGVAPSTPEEIAYWEEQDRLLQAGRYHAKLLMRMDQQGVDRPLLVAADGAAIPATTPVIGVEIDGQACALVLESMRNIDEHIVNLTIGKTAVSVTYCDLVDCVRVIKKDGAQTPTAIPLRIGGIDVNKQLVLLYEGERYGQQSPGIPLEDQSFTRTTWGTWKQQHPDTLLYEGG